MEYFSTCGIEAVAKINGVLCHLYQPIFCYVIIARDEILIRKTIIYIMRQR